MNGELFFYVIPAVLLVLLIIVIFVPDADESHSTEEEKAEKKQPPVATETPRVEECEKIPQGTARHDTVLLTPPPIAEPRTYEEGLSKTRESFFARLRQIFTASVVTEELLAEMEEILYRADVGVATVTMLLNEVRNHRSTIKSGEEGYLLLKERILTILREVERPFDLGGVRPLVILMVGVNGCGKTTTIGKLAARFATDGKKVIVAAADTFRAAAVDQIAAWCARSGVEIVTDHEGADPAAVAYRAVSKAIAEGDEIVIIDTAGRLQNRVNLMEELRKVHRVIGKAMAGAPHEVILVIDANNGQNALVQAREFGSAVGITGIIATKLDGTAKGGALIGIAHELRTPIYFVGMGEGPTDLRPFSATEFTEALFS